MIYISGAITNSDPAIQQANLDRFHEKAKELKDLGYNVFNPADWETDGKRWAWYIARDAKWILDNKPSHFYFMKGWETSVGADIEHELALLLGADMTYEESELLIDPLDSEE